MGFDGAVQLSRLLVHRLMTTSGAALILFLLAYTVHILQCMQKRDAFTHADQGADKQRPSGIGTTASKQSQNMQSLITKQFGPNLEG